MAAALATLLVTLPVAGISAKGEVLPLASDTRSGWTKFQGNPVLGGSYGTCFDVSVLRENGNYRMWFSWRPRHSIALVTSRDGRHWSSPPQIVFGPRPGSGWEEEVNRPSILKRGKRYYMWYTGQAQAHSFIGCAVSPDGIEWKRQNERPVLSPEQPREKVAVMCPDVLWDSKMGRFRMWYSGGGQYEPDAIGYASSPDGIIWTRDTRNPIFTANPSQAWEAEKVTACHVVQMSGWHLMFYIGFRDRDHAQIGLARSRDGITGWERHPANPVIRPGAKSWDSDACYKPYATYDGAEWLLWYNGRQGGIEQIGLAIHPGGDLGFR